MDLKQREEAAQKLAASVKEALGRIVGDGEAKKPADKTQPPAET